MSKVNDLLNQQFERLTVIKRVENNQNGRARWLCRCSCGNEIITYGYRLTDGSTQSCGCLRRERIVNSVTKHHKSNTKIYNIWSSMKQRCYNPKSKHYKNYGARGIKICDEWKNNFSSFYDWAINNGYIENAEHKSCTIDRINNDGDYEPNNCRWADMKTQCNNRRKRKKYV